MAELFISQINVGGQLYDLHDKRVEGLVGGGITFVGTAIAEYYNGSTWVAFTEAVDQVAATKIRRGAGEGEVTLANGNLFVATLGTEYIYNGTDGKIYRLGRPGTLGDLAPRDLVDIQAIFAGQSHTHTVSVSGEGNVSGTAVDTHNYTPQGTVDLSGTVTAVFEGTEDVVDVTVTNEHAAVPAHTYTPEGTISAITPAGTIATGSGAANYTPAGTVAAPEVTVTNATAGGTVGNTIAGGTVTLAAGTGDDFQVTGTVSAPSFTRPTASFSGAAHKHEFTGTKVTTESASLTPAGTVKTTIGGTAVNASVSGEVLELSAASLSATSTFTGTAAPHTHQVTPAGTIANATAGGTVTLSGGSVGAPTFTGGKIKATFAGTAHNHTFTGTAHSHTANATAPAFTGKGVQLTFAGNAVTPTFTGTEATLAHAAHTHTARASGTVTPTGFVTVNAGQLEATFVGKAATLTHTVTQGTVSITATGTAAAATQGGTVSLSYKD